MPVSSHNPQYPVPGEVPGEPDPVPGEVPGDPDPDSDPDPGPGPEPDPSPQPERAPDVDPVPDVPDQPPPVPIKEPQSPPEVGDPEPTPPTRLWQRGLRHSVLAGVMLTAMAGGLSGCDELGPEARGERQVTALQSMARERSCMPYFDIASVRWQESGAVEFLLRDGTRWRNETQSACLHGSKQVKFAFDSADTEVCSGNAMHVLQPQHQVFRHLGTCELGRFVVQ